MDDSFWEEIERAKKLSGTQKMSESLRLFDEVSRRMLAGVKSQFPGISDNKALQIRRERIDIIRKLEALP